MVGTALDSPSVTVASNGSTITLSMQKSGGGDVRFWFSDGVHTHDCTPAATATLTAGTDTSPQINYVYVLKSTKALTVSTTAFPSAEHAPVATVLCQSAASAQTDGVYKMHAWTDHVSGSSDSNGHVCHINYWIRQQPATWTSGVALTPSVGAATFDVATSAGVVLQLHQHDFPAFDTSTGSEVMLVNDSATAYKRVGDLVSQLTDSTGASMSGKFYNLVFWGVVSEASGDCQLMCNLPNGSYVSEQAAIDDDDRTANYSIPSVFRGVGFLIARLTVRHQVAGNTYSISQNEDLRGLFPTTGAGSGAASQSDYPDNAFTIYDETDTTKILAFQCSGITTATTRTLTVPNASGTIALTSRPMRVTLYGGITAAGQWTNQPAAEAFIFGHTRHVTKVDLTGYTQARLVITLHTTAANAGAKCYLKYYTSYSETVGDYLDIGTSSVEVAIDSTDTCVASSWVNLAAGAIADIFVAVTGDGGDGVIDPTFGLVAADFR